jgi:hypothetical protein
MLSICSSCREIYDPKIDEAQNSLVVEGLMTDEVRPYVIKLSIAEPFNSYDNYPLVRSAKVSITDNKGNIFNLQDEGGTYVSDPKELIGQAGRIYTLHIETTDGNIYESTPQFLLPNYSDVKASAVFKTKEILVQDYNGNYSKSTINGVDLLYDIKYDSDTMPKFRFLQTMTTEYIYINTYHPEFLKRVLRELYSRSPVVFCWSASVPDDLVNLTDEEYETSNDLIQKHSVCFIPTYYTKQTNEIDSILPYVVYVHKGSVDTVYILPPDTVVNVPIVNRIIRVTQYRLNQETFQYYKNINTLLSAQGKIFDPVAFQFTGNITCKNNPQKKALGFFEASSAITKYYFIRPGEDTVHTIQSYNPPAPEGCERWDSIPMDQGSTEEPVPPSFWVN